MSNNLQILEIVILKVVRHSLSCHTWFVERKVLKVVTQNFLTSSDILEDATYILYIGRLIFF